MTSASEKLASGAFAKTGRSFFRAGRAAELPAINKPLLTWFEWYARRFVRKHFHSVRLSKTGYPPSIHEGPVVIYLNHASWWDPMACIVLKNTFFAESRCYAPMDSAAMEKYAFFRRLGFFPVEQNTARGAAQFLLTASAILNQGDSVLWITPEGQFSDTRKRPLLFKPGLRHLATRTSREFTFLPLAIEYSFWEERLPEILLRYGRPVPAGEVGSTDRALESALEQSMDALSDEAISRDPNSFECLLRRETGTSLVYDFWRTGREWMRGRSFNPQHGVK